MATRNNPFMPGTAPKTPTPSTSAPMPGSSAGNAADTFELDLTNVDTSGGFHIPEGTGDQAGFQLKSFTAITPAAMWKVAETVEALGVGQTGTVVKFKRSDVINRECGLVVEDNDYNGSVRSSIARVISVKELA